MTVAKGISRELIVQAALDLLDEEGIDGVTARALAERLGVRAPALYWHMSNKQEILDEMGTEIRRRVAARLTNAQDLVGWREQLTTFARALRAEYLAHRNGAKTFAGTKLTDPSVLQVQEAWLARWKDTGLDAQDGAAAAQLVTSFVVGFVIDEQERGVPLRYLLATPDPAAAEQVPLVREAGQHLFADHDERFERYLDVVLTGIAVRFVGEAGPTGGDASG